MWEALKQLNSEPVVVLKKLKCVEDELKQYIQRKPSAKCEERPNDASKAASPLLTPAIGENSQPQSKVEHSLSAKRKASLEDAVNDANPGYFKNTKKFKKDKGLGRGSNDTSASKPQKSKPGGSLLKVKLFKTQKKSGADLIKKDSCEEKKKKLKEKHREKVSVIEENSVPECKSPLSDAPNAVLSYLQLMPMPVVDEERGGELLEHSDETLYPSNLTRSDSLETVALALDDRDEEAAQICPLKTSRIECVDLISPGSSPKDDTANTPLSDAFNQVNDVPSKVMLPSAGAHESELLTEFIASSNAKCSEKNSNNGSVGADIVMDMSSNRCPENSEVSVEAPPVCQSETVQGAEEMNSGSRKSLTTIPDCSTQLKSSPESNQNNQKRIIRTESVLETMLRSDPLDQTSTVECDATISSSCKGAHSDDKDDIVLEYRSSEKEAPQDLADPEVLNEPSTNLNQNVLPNQGESSQHSDETVPKQIKPSNSSNTSVAAVFTSAFKLSEEDLRMVDQNSQQNLAEQKKTMISKINEARQAFQILADAAKPHDLSIRMKLLQYDTLKKELENMIKDKETIADRVKNLTAECESLEKKSEKLFQETNIAQQTKLETEIQLREQQMDLCREQLLLGVDCKLDETYPKFNVMREKQGKVDNLSREVAKKNIAAKAVEEAFTQSKLLLEKYRKQLQDLTNQENEGKRTFEKLAERLDALKAEIKTKSDEGNQNFTKQKEIWLKCIDLREELLKIEALEKLCDVHNRRKQALSHDYYIYDQLNSRSFFSSQDVAATISPTTTSQEMLSRIPANTTSLSNQTDSSVTSEQSHESSSSITLNQLAEVIPYYAHYLKDSKVSRNVSVDEGVLCRNVIRGCRQYGIWKAAYLKDPLRIKSLDEETLKQSSAYIKEFAIPLFQLWTMKNSNTSSILSFIVNEEFKNNGYGFSSLDPVDMRNMLESSVRDAIEIGKRCAENSSFTVCAPTTHVEYSVSTSDASSVPAITSQAQTAPECSVVDSRRLGPHLRLRNVFAEPCANSHISNAQEGSGSFLQATQSTQTQVSLQTPATTAPGMNLIASTTHPENQLTSAQMWSNAQLNNSVVAFQSTVVQKTAVVVPMSNGQYSNTSGRCITMATNSTPASPQVTTQGAPSPHYQMNNVVPTYPQSSFQAVSSAQYSQQMNQNPAGNYLFLRAITPAQNSQDIISNTGLAGTVRVQRQPGISQIEGMRNQGRTAQMPMTIQSREQINHRPHSVHPNHQIMEQRVLMMQSSAVNAQNRQNVNRIAMQNQPAGVQCSSQTQLTHPHQSNMRQVPFSCLCCKQEAYQKCSGCQKAYYCSSVCQLAHWDEHRKSCTKK